MEFISWNPLEIYRNWRRRREAEYIVRINTPRMKIKGKITEALVRPRFKYVAFRGIPYALPPLGELRFQPPHPIPNPPDGQRTLKAYFKPNACAQQVTCDTVKGSEDCLYLNVFTPKKPKDIPELLPVLVYIHGGGFITGESGPLNPESILREDLIVVTINYRLDIFGFLNMRAENCRGNAGMKDQVMALNWVQDNIKAFKGDRDNVTICGQSAGGSSVNFHMISPMSKGLFHKAIVMSGGVYCPWGFGGSAKYVKQLFKNAMEKENEMRTVAVRALQEVSTENLLRHGHRIMNEAFEFRPKRMTADFRPTVEYDQKDAFLPYPVEILMETAEGVPTIAGITKQEGYQTFRADPIGSIEASQNDDALKKILRDNFCWKDPAAVDRHFATIKASYFPNEGNTDKEEKKHQYASLVTDIYFRRFYDNFNFGNLFDNEGPPFYVYEFDYFKGEPLFAMDILLDSGEPVIMPKAAEHSDDKYFLLLPEYLQKPYFLIPEESRMKRREIVRVKKNLCNLWGSFCKTGVPESRVRGDSHVNWLKHTEQDPHYLHIARNLSLVRGLLNEERWADLNAMCRLESTMPSLAETPKTPGNESKLFPLINLEFDPSSLETELIHLRPDHSSLQTARRGRQLEPEPSLSEAVVEIHPEPQPKLLETVVEIHPEPQPKLLETVAEIHPEPQPKSLETAVELLNLEPDPSSLETMVEIHPEPQPKSLETAVELLNLEPDLSSLETMVGIHPEPAPSLLETVVEVHPEPDPSSLETAVELLNLEPDSSSLETMVEIHPEPQPKLLETVAEIHPEPQPKSLETAVELLNLEPDPSSLETMVGIHPEPDPSLLETVVEVYPEPEPDTSSWKTAVEMLHPESEPLSPETAVKLLYLEPDSSLPERVVKHLESEPPLPETAIKVLYPESEPSSPETAVKLLYVESEPSSPETAIKQLPYPSSEPSSPETAIKLLYPESETSSPETTVKLLYPESEPSSPETAIEVLYPESEPSSPETAIEVLYPESEPSSPETAVKLLYPESEPSLPEIAVKLLYPESEPSSPETAVKLLYPESEPSSPETAIKHLYLEPEPSSPGIEL